MTIHRPVNEAGEASGKTLAISSWTSCSFNGAPARGPDERQPVDRL